VSCELCAVCCVLCAVRCALCVARCMCSVMCSAPVYLCYEYRDEDDIMFVSSVYWGLLFRFH